MRALRPVFAQDAGKNEIFLPSAEQGVRDLERRVRCRLRAQNRYILSKGREVAIRASLSILEF